MACPIARASHRHGISGSRLSGQLSSHRHRKFMAMLAKNPSADSSSVEDPTLTKKRPPCDMGFPKGLGRISHISFPSQYTGLKLCANALANSCETGAVRMRLCHLRHHLSTSNPRCVICSSVPTTDWPATITASTPKSSFTRVAADSLSATSMRMSPSLSWL